MASTVPRPFGASAASSQRKTPIRNAQSRRVHVAAKASTVDPGAKVLVCGSTGGVGQLVVAKLVQKGYQVRALTRNKSKAQSAFAGSPEVEIVELDLRDGAAVSGSNVFDGCQAVVMATGTTAFPSNRWEGNNGPRPTDFDSPRNLISAAPKSLRRFVLCTSAGVERFKTFPFFILNSFGVLTFKKESEDFLRQSGIPFTIVRPSRLTDGPYTSYDLNTLLKATSGERQNVELSLQDNQVGEASRIAVAELIVQALGMPELEGVTLSISSTQGDGPGDDPARWKALVNSVLA